MKFALQIQSVPQKQNLDIEPSRNNEGQSAFGEWDIRKEENIRPKVEETQFENIEKKEFETFNREEVKPEKDEELDTPPFFRRRK
jgi:cell division protein FtsZ